MSKVKINELGLRDGHQSLMATRMLTSDMLPILNKMDKAGYWAMEVWGGATFDSCIRFLNEDPWKRIRDIKKGLPNTQTMMLLRAQNILGYNHYPDDVVEKFVERAAVNGVDIFRIFDALNDPRNLQTAMKAVKKAGKHAQAAISYTVSPVHTVDAYVSLAKEMKEMGADSICIKDMASLLKPYDAYELVSRLKKEVGLPVDLHSHATTGMSVATLLKAVEAGAEIIDTTISPLSMGTSHSATESMVATFEGTEYDTGISHTKLLEIAAHFREVLPKYQQFKTSFSGADTRILEAQIPGGMLSNLEKQMKDLGAADKMGEVMEETARVREDFGFPPLVTPSSQIVGTQAVMNVLQGRYKVLTEQSLKLLVGKYGRTAADKNPELVERALKEMGMDAPITHRPADDLEPGLAKFEAELKEKLGVKKVEIDDVLTYALFPKVALDFFSKRDQGPVEFKPEEAAPCAPAASGGSTSEAKSYVVTVDGSDYDVTVRDGGTVLVEAAGNAPAPAPAASASGGGEAVEAPSGGVVLKLHFSNGDSVKKGDTIMTIESMKMELPVNSTGSGKIKYLVGSGDTITTNQKIAELS